MAPNTAFRGGNISEDSLATSTAILAAAYAVCQPESLPRPSTDMPRVLLDEEPMERAMEADERASVLDFLLDASFRTKFSGNVGAEAEISPDDLDPRRRRIVNEGKWWINSMISPASRLTGAVVVQSILTRFGNQITVYTSTLKSIRARFLLPRSGLSRQFPSSLALMNNYVELRSYAFKVSKHARRPTPVRMDFIGPWLECLKNLTLIDPGVDCSYRRFD
jgi:hypothetical protein